MGYPQLARQRKMQIVGMKVQDVDILYQPGKLIHLDRVISEPGTIQHFSAQRMRNTENKCSLRD